MKLLNIAQLTSSCDIYINKCYFDSESELHTHNFIEIVYVADGEAYHIIGDETITMKKGDITIINYDTSHKLVAKNGGFTVYNCVFTPTFLDSMLASSRDFCDLNHNVLVGNFYNYTFKDFIHVSCGVSSNAEALSIYNKMLIEYCEKKIGYKEYIRGLLIELLVLIFRNENDINNINKKEIYPIIEYISKNFRHPLKVEMLAYLANLSMSVFFRKFKSTTGYNVTEFIQRLRVEEACNLLISTQKSVIEIANEVGYSDIKHFYNVFKKITNSLPKEIRKTATKTL